jgi:hypothetical protein
LLSVFKHIYFNAKQGLLYKFLLLSLISLLPDQILFSESLIKYVPSNSLWIVESKNYEDSISQIREMVFSFDPGILKAIDKESDKFFIPLMNIQKTKQIGIETDEKIIIFGGPLIEKEQWGIVFHVSDEDNLLSHFEDKLGFKKGKTKIKEIEYYQKILKIQKKTKKYTNPFQYNKKGTKNPNIKPVTITKRFFLFPVEDNIFILVSDLYLLKKIAYSKNKSFADNQSYIDLNEKLENYTFSIYLNSNRLDRSAIYLLRSIMPKYSIIPQFQTIYQSAGFGISAKKKKLDIVSLSKFKKDLAENENWKNLKGRGLPKSSGKFPSGELVVFFINLDILAATDFMMKKNPFFKQSFDTMDLKAKKKTGKGIKELFLEKMNGEILFALYTLDTKGEKHDALISFGFKSEKDVQETMGLLQILLKSNKKSNVGIFKKVKGKNYYYLSLGYKQGIYLLPDFKNLVIALQIKSLKAYKNWKKNKNSLQENYQSSGFENFGLMINVENLLKSLGTNVPIEVQILLLPFNGLRKLSLVSEQNDEFSKIKIHIQAK